MILFIIKTGQVNNAIKVLLLGLQYKLSWDIAMERQSGAYYKKQVSNAVEDYKLAHPIQFECEIHGKDYKKWLKENPK